MKGTRRTPAPQNRAIKFAVASASLLSLSAVPAIVHADGAGDATPSSSGVYVTILSPNPGTDLTGKKQVEISAYYESSFGVSSLDLYIDGRRMATQHLTTAESRGEISFVVDPASLQPGDHAIVVRATATDEEVASARTVLSLPTVTTSNISPTVNSPAADQNSAATQPDVAGAPTIQVESPSTSDTVQGIVQIKVNAVDASGKPPYVSLFIDRSFKTLRNFAPYTFDWDTTKLPNGPHLIEVFGYNDAQQVGHASPVRVNVNNPSGNTFERHDLSDFAPISDHTLAKSASRPLASKSNAGKPKTASAHIKRAAVQPKLSFEFLDSVVPHLVSSDKQMARLDINESALSLDNTRGLLDNGATVPSLDDLAMSNRVASHATKTSVTKAGSVVRRAAHKNVPHLRSEPAILSELSGMTEPIGSLRSSDQLDNLSAAPVSTTLAGGQIEPDSGYAPNVVVTRRASAKSVPSLVEKSKAHHLQMASARIEANPELAPGTDNIVAPRVDINALERAMQPMPESAAPAERVSVRALSIRDMHRLRGAYQVVVDDQRISLNEPLQERGALLYAPMRQIFESQGGQLTWDQTKHQVNAVTDTGEVVLRIGSHHAIVNNRAVKMQGAAYLLNNRTMLPVDFYATAMNASVTFDPISGHLVIESNR